jgi:hypothetical protein
LFEGPLAATLGVVGVAAAAVGGVLVVGTPSSRTAPTTRIVPALGPRAVGAAIEGALP